MDFTSNLVNFGGKMEIVRENLCSIPKKKCHHFFWPEIKLGKSINLKSPAGENL